MNTTSKVITTTRASYQLIVERYALAPARAFAIACSKLPRKTCDGPKTDETYSNDILGLDRSLEITLFVGQVPNMRIFTVNRELVTNFSGYFWARCSDRLARPGQHVFFHIPAEPLFTFRRFLLWLNGGGLAKVDADRHNIELFDLATRYDVPLLINDLLEEFQRHFNVREPRPRNINRLYACQNTSRLQRLNAWLWARVSDGMSMQADSRIDMDPRHFMWDLLCAQLRDYGLSFEHQQFDETFPEFATPRFMWQLGLDMYGLRSARRTAEDYGQGSLCRDFHVHEDGSHCDPTWSNWVWIA